MSRASVSKAGIATNCRGTDCGVTLELLELELYRSWWSLNLRFVCTLVAKAPLRWLRLAAASRPDRLVVAGCSLAWSFTLTICFGRWPAWQWSLQEQPFLDHRPKAPEAQKLLNPQQPLCLQALGSLECWRSWCCFLLEGHGCQQPAG